MFQVIIELHFNDFTWDFTYETFRNQWVPLNWENRAKEDYKPEKKVADVH